MHTHVQGVKFDPACPQILRLEFAHTNSRSSPDQLLQNTPLYYGDTSTAPAAFFAIPSQFSCNPNLMGTCKSVRYACAYLFNN